MSHLAARFYATQRVYRRRAWPPAKKENRLTLSPPTQATLYAGWGEVQCVPEPKPLSPETSETNKAAIAVLRSLSNVSDEEAQEQRETWALLEQALDEDRLM